MAWQSHVLGTSSVTRELVNVESVLKPDHKPLTILTGDCRNLLKALPTASVHCCVTSPPYWGLRDYGRAGQLGQEQTPEQFVEALLSVFADVRRVLRDDATLWLNLGDSYASGWPCNRRNQIGNGSLPNGRRTARPARLGPGLKEKDLVGIPWRVALALQADGWFLRSDIIWHKPNVMPESVTDRPTKAHEYLFLFSKSKRYYYDAEAIKEPASLDSTNRLLRGISDSHKYANGATEQKVQAILRPRENRMDKQRWHSRRHAGFNGRWDAMTKAQQSSGMRNKRTVWLVSTQPYKGAHFATYPPNLIAPCILAGTSARGCCRDCGAPWRRITRKGAALEGWKKHCGADSSGSYHGRATKEFSAAGVQDASTLKAQILAGMREVRTVGWQPSCTCEAGEPVPCMVLDPFAGSGTTGQVALELGRQAVLIELNPDYVKLIQERCTSTQPLALAA